MKLSENVQNPGSALGEAIGTQMEKALNHYLNDWVDNFACRLITKGKINQKTQKETKLLLYDDHGTAYNIDAVVTNEATQPLILIEYKYIRYKKHNRDKGSWLCTAHNAIRRRYGSVRSSIAILAGSWSRTSVAMMKSHDINIFIIPFDTITVLLHAHGIKFDWGEKDRDTAIESWDKYSSLSDAEKQAIAEAMIAGIKPDLEESIERILDDSAEREVSSVVIEVHTNLGEVRRFEFPSVDAALDFLEDFSVEELLDTSKSLSLFESPEIDE